MQLPLELKSPFICSAMTSLPDLRAADRKISDSFHYAIVKQKCAERPISVLYLIFQSTTACQRFQRLLPTARQEVVKTSKRGSRETPAGLRQNYTQLLLGPFTL